MMGPTEVAEQVGFTGGVNKEQRGNRVSVEVSGEGYPRVRTDSVGTLRQGGADLGRERSRSSNTRNDVRILWRT